MPSSAQEAITPALGSSRRTWHIRRASLDSLPHPISVQIIGSILLYAGAVSLLIGYLGIVFSGFADGIGRGIRNFFFPFLGFGDAMRRFHFLIWLWGGGIAGIAIGSLIL